MISLSENTRSYPASVKSTGMSPTSPAFTASAEENEFASTNSRGRIVMIENSDMITMITILNTLSVPLFETIFPSYHSDVWLTCFAIKFADASRIMLMIELNNPIAVANEY